MKLHESHFKKDGVGVEVFGGTARTLRKFGDEGFGGFCAQLTGINPSCRLGMLLTAFPVAGAAAWHSLMGFVTFSLSGGAGLGLAWGAHISFASVFPEPTASSPCTEPAWGGVLGWVSHLSPCSKQNSGCLFFFPVVLSHLFFEPKFSGQAAFDGAGRLWLYLCLGVLLFQTTRAEFLLQLSSLCPSRCLFVWEPGGEFHLQPYQPYLLLP